MTDLNELSQFEKDLKALIESRESFQPVYVSPVYSSNKSTSISVNKSEHECDTPPRTYMTIREHGQPYKSNHVITRMAIGEHGQPYKWSRSATK